MPRIRLSSKRRVKIRIQFGDSICELNKKDDCDNGTDNVDNEASGSVVREKDGVVEEDRHSPMKNNNQGGMFRLDDTEGIREKSAEEFSCIAEVYSSPGCFVHTHDASIDKFMDSNNS
nr:hypothetical protein [Tanacetum cinerariifolium]